MVPSEEKKKKNEPGLSEELLDGFVTFDPTVSCKTTQLIFNEVLFLYAESMELNKLLHFVNFGDFSHRLVQYFNFDFFCLKQPYIALMLTYYFNLCRAR